VTNGCFDVKTKAEKGQGFALNANDFKKMILGANHFFERKKESINALNVFPVPDGDTGTNMSMTLKAAVEGSIQYKGQSIGELSEIVASNALMGARGNSGVILSQIFKGLARGLRNKDTISPAELSKAFQYGVVYAYKAVSKPVEGTILTVAREMARGIRRAVVKGGNLYDSIEEAIESGKEALEKTTEMLPVLKKAGVVDAGGLGLLVFFEGCLFALKRSFNEIMTYKEKEPREKAVPDADSVFQSTAEPLDLDYPYCTEMIIKSDSGYFGSLKENLASCGDSLLVVTDSRAAKIHIHTACPDLVLQTALQYGTLHDIKIENMHDQHKEAFAPTPAIENTIILPGDNRQEKGAVGIVAVSFGKGFREVFLSLGVDEVVFGGQTMNPKVEDLVNAVDNLTQEAAIILPNNKNIIMVAEQVKILTDKKVEVLETRSLPEGISALLAYRTAATLEDNFASMQQGAGRVKTGLVTFATRDALINDREVAPGHYLGLSGEDIVTAGQDLYCAALDLAREILKPENDIITVFYGEDVKRAEASNLVSALEDLYPELEVELQYGGQPLYYYVFSVE